MKYYLFKIGLNSEVSQQQVVDKIRSNGGEVIQISSGLCAKMRSPLAAVHALFSETSGLNIEPFDVASAKDLPPDVRAFLDQA